MNNNKFKPFIDYNTEMGYVEVVIEEASYYATRVNSRLTLLLADDNSIIGFRISIHA